MSYCLHLLDVVAETVSAGKNKKFFRLAPRCSGEFFFVGICWSSKGAFILYSSVVVSRVLFFLSDFGLLTLTRMKNIVE